MTFNYHIMQAYSREILGSAFFCPGSESDENRNIIK